MKIVKPSAELLWITPNAAQNIELAGRVCYKSCDKITNDSAAKFVSKIMKSGHHSVIEHASASIRFVCDRGVTHELVRHRISSHSQESSRYCNYSKNKFGSEITVVEPPFRDESSREIWLEGVAEAERTYMDMIHNGEKPEIARSLLPTCLKTEIVTTANFREWLHIIALRSSLNKRAHPQIRELIDMARKLLVDACSEVFACEV